MRRGFFAEHLNSHEHDDPTNQHTARKRGLFETIRGRGGSH